MCDDVLVIDGSRWAYCDSVGELAKALGVRQKKVSDDPFDCCLCNAHWDKLGARRATDAEGWPNPAYIIDRTPDTGDGHE